MTLNEFLIADKNIDNVKGEYGLYTSIKYLLENDNKNDRTIKALRNVFESYVTLETVQDEIPGGGVITSLELNLIRVPNNVEKAINERAKLIQKKKEDLEEKKQQEIINLLKDGDELSK